MPILDISNFTQFTAINLLADGGAVGGPVIVPSAAQIVLNWSLEDGKIARNVLYGKYSGAFAGTQAQANGILTALATGAAWTALAAQLATTTILGGISIRDVNTANQPLIVSNTAGAGGTGAGESMPNEVAAVITFRTSLVGRGNRGRMFVPGWTTASTAAGNVMSVAAFNALQGWANTLAGALAGQGYTLALGQKHRIAYTSPKGHPHADRPAFALPITQTVVRDNHWDTIRRRGLK